MNNKIVKGDTIFFKDDIKINEEKIAESLNLAEIPVLTENLTLFYKGNLFYPTKEKTEDYIKIYTEIYGLKKADSVKLQEEQFFTKNGALISKLQEEFLKDFITGLECLDDTHPFKTKLAYSALSGIEEKIIEYYNEQIRQVEPLEGIEGKISEDKEGILNSLKGLERAMIIENKLYNLITIPEYMVHFKNAFKPKTYEIIEKEIGGKNPEETSSILEKNRENIHKKVFSSLKNKIWNSKRSSKILLDGIYWIPDFKGSIAEIKDNYQKLIEMHIKIEALRKYTK